MEARRAQRHPGPQRAFPLISLARRSRPCNQSASFNITLARTYKWETENTADQTAFIRTVVELFRSLVGAPLHLVGVDDTRSTFSKYQRVLTETAHSQQPPQQMVTPSHRPTGRPSLPPPQSPSQTACLSPWRLPRLPKLLILTSSKLPHVLHHLRIP